MESFIMDRDYKDYESITVGSSAKGFTTTKINPTTGEYANRAVEAAFCRLEEAAIRYRLDGNDPTTNEGMLMYPGETLVITNPANIRRFRAIRDGSVDGVLKVSYGWRY